MENLIYIVLLILHNIALVGCAAAPFYNLRLVNQRGKFGPKVYYELDLVVERTLQGLEPYCWTFIFTLFITGLGFPVTHYLFHDEWRSISNIALVAFILKHLVVIGLVLLALRVTFYINPKLKKIMQTFSSDLQPEEETRKAFFALRAKRKQLCRVCFVLALLILILSPILRFY